MERNVKQQLREGFLEDLSKIKVNIIQGHYKAAAVRLEALYSEIVEELEDSGCSDDAH